MFFKAHNGRMRGEGELTVCRKGWTTAVKNLKITQNKKRRQCSCEQQVLVKSSFSRSRGCRKCAIHVFWRTLRRRNGERSTFMLMLKSGLGRIDGKRSAWPLFMLVECGSLAVEYNTAKFRCLLRAVFGVKDLTVAVFLQRCRLSKLF